MISAHMTQDLMWFQALHLYEIPFADSIYVEIVVDPGANATEADY